MAEDNNGYLDSDQTIINFFVRELGGSFAQLASEDPSRALRSWWKYRKTSQNAAIGTTILGSIALVGGVLTGAPLLLGAGLLVASGSGLLIKHHGEGAAAHKLESDILDEMQPIVAALERLERQGANSSRLVSIYDRLVRAAAAGRLDVSDRDQMRSFFQRELEQAKVFEEVAAGLSSPPAVAPEASAQLPQADRGMQQESAARLNAPETISPPDRDLPASPPDVPPNRFAPIPAPEIQEIPVEDLPALQPPASAVAHAYDVRSLAKTGYVESILFLGVSQSGKTTVADQLGRELRSTYGANLRACYITPVYRDKGDNDERSLFDWCDFTVRRPLLNETDPYKISAAYQEFDEVLTEFLAWDSDRDHPKLFIADELTLHAQAAGVGNKLNPNGNKTARNFFGKLVNAINANASGGKAAGIALWGLAPSGAVGAIGLNQAAMATATAVFVGNLKHWNGGVYEGAKRNSLAPQQPPDRDLTDYCTRRDIDRVVSVAAGEWQPLIAYDVPRPRKQLEKIYQERENLQPHPENLQPPVNFSDTPVNPETQPESEFPSSDVNAENFTFTDFQLGKTVFLAVKAAMEGGKGKTEIVEEVLECKGRHYKKGCAWLEALLKKHGGNL